MTGAELDSKNLIPKVALRKAMEEWEGTYAMHIPRAAIELEEGLISSGAFKTVYKGP